MKSQYVTLRNTGRGGVAFCDVRRDDPARTGGIKNGMVIDDDKNQNLWHNAVGGCT
jgi:hypothetical protein